MYLVIIPPSYMLQLSGASNPPREMRKRREREREIWNCRLASKREASTETVDAAGGAILDRRRNAAQ